MKEITIQVPDDCEVKIVKKENKFKKDDIITTKVGRFIAIYEKTDSCRDGSSYKVVYYSTLYNAETDKVIYLDGLRYGIGTERDCKKASDTEISILIAALKREAVKNLKARKVLKEIFNIDYEPIIRTYQDLIDNRVKLEGFYIDAISDVVSSKLLYTNANTTNRNIAASEKVAKSMLAMAMISQLMPYYGGEITDEEWEDSTNKYVIVKIRGDIYIDDDFIHKYHFLAFHTGEQRDDFLKYNEQLVKDYLMID